MQYIKFPALILFFAVLVGLLYASPQFLIGRALEKSGEPFVIIQLTHHSDAAQGYIPRAREIYDGNYPPNDLHFDSNLPSPFGPFPIPATFLALSIFLLGGNINSAFLAATFAFSAIIFLAFYFLGIVITGRRVWAIFIGFLGSLTPLAIHLPRALQSWQLFLDIAAKNFIPLIKTPLLSLFLGRIEDPLLTYPIYIPTIVALILFWRKPNYKTAFLAAALVGLMYYSYFHYWIYLTIIVGLIFLFALFTRRENPARFKAVLVLLGVLAVLTLPYWINYFQFSQLDSADDFARRIGINTGRYLQFAKPFSVVFDYIFYILLAGWVYWIFWKRHEQKNLAIFYWLCIAAMFIVWNVQVVTGFVPQPTHWFRTVSPFILVMLLHGVYELSKKIDYKKVAVMLLILSALLVSKKVVNALIFLNPPQEILKEYTFDKDIVDSWNWINENLPGEPKVVSPSLVTSFYLNGQTSARPYLPIGGSTPASNNALEERFLRAHKIFGISETDFEKRLKSGPKNACLEPEQGAVRGYYSEICDSHTRLNLGKPMLHLYFLYYKNPKNVDGFRYISQEQAEVMISRYKELKIDWQDIEADYIYYGPWEKELISTDFSGDLNLELVYKNPSVEIYKITKASVL